MTLSVHWHVRVGLGRVTPDLTSVHCKMFGRVVLYDISVALLEYKISLNHSCTEDTTYSEKV